MLTAQGTRLTSCSTRVACPPRMPSPRSPSYLGGRHWASSERRQRSSFPSFRPCCRASQETCPVSQDTVTPCKKWSRRELSLTTVFQGTSSNHSPGCWVHGETPRWNNALFWQRRRCYTKVSTTCSSTLCTFAHWRWLATGTASRCSRRKEILYTLASLEVRTVCPMTMEAEEAETSVTISTHGYLQVLT